MCIRPNWLVSNALRLPDRFTSRLLADVVDTRIWLLTQLHLIKLHRRWHKTLAQLYTGWMQDASVHGKEELSSDLSFASKTAYFSHFDPQNRGRVKCEARTLSNKPISKHQHLPAFWRHRSITATWIENSCCKRFICMNTSQNNTQNKSETLREKTGFSLDFKGALVTLVTVWNIVEFRQKISTARGIRTTLGLRSKASSRPAKCGVPASRASHGWCPSRRHDLTTASNFYM